MGVQVNREEGNDADTPSTSAAPASDAAGSRPSLMRRILAAPLRALLGPRTGARVIAGHDLAPVIGADVWQPDALQVIHRAALLARNAGAAVVDRRHVLLALLEAPPLAALWKACLPDIPGSTAALLALPFTPSTAPLCPPGASDDVVRILDTTARFAAFLGRNRASATELLVRLIQDDDAFAKVLTDHGLAVADVVRFVCHGVLEHPTFDDASAPPGRRLDVVAFNDNYTTQESVVALLVTVFGIPERFATKLMFDVHRNGEAVILTAERAVAIERVNSALSFARERGLPIRLSLAPFSPSQAQDSASVPSGAADRS